MLARADILARLRVATQTQHLPRDLGEAVLDLLAPRQKRSPPARVARRDGLLCDAARLISGSVHARARRLAQEINSPGNDPVGNLVRQALDIDPYRDPPSLRQLRRILSKALVGHFGH